MLCERFWPYQHLLTAIFAELLLITLDHLCQQIGLAKNVSVVGPFDYQKIPEWVR